MSILSRFPSYDIVIKGAAATFKRYPLTLISAVLATIAAVYLIDYDISKSDDWMERLLAASILGIPLFIALTNFAQKQRLNRMINLALQAGGAILLIAYYLSLPDSMDSAQIYWVRFALLGVGLHFLVAVLPYSVGSQIGAFWQYNKSLFLRFLMASLYSAVLYIGLTIALAAADHLFGFDVKDERYFQMWVIIVGIFNTLIFLSGIPEDLNNLSDTVEYPKGLKVFTQYILLPLVALFYFVILIAYEAKIIIQWNWPKGWVSHLVLWYAVVGILSSLLLHPLREKAGNLWIQVFTKWFYRALVPLVVLLFLAITQRVSDYGITENRYFVLAMAIGLSIVVLHFIFSKAKDIRIIPGVLCVLAFLAAYGPWGAFSVSESCQQGRLDTMMESYNIIVDGAVQETAVAIPFEDRKQMSSIITYLHDWHGLESFSDWFSDSTLVVLDTVAPYTRDNEIATLMGFEWVPSWQDSVTEGGSFSIHRQTTRTADIDGYEYMIELDLNEVSNDKKEFKVDDVSFTATLNEEWSVIAIRAGAEEDDGSAVEIGITEPLKDMIEYPSVQLLPEQVSFHGECDRFDALVVLEYLSGSGGMDSIKVHTGRLDLLLHLK